MRLVLGLSLTATSAVWALVDTKDGAILADESVALGSVNEIARATACSVQNFALQSEHDIDGIHITWTDDARNHAIRLRSKLRLFGFDTIEHVSEEEAREGRNRTARHIAPHLTLAYGAARAQHVDDTPHLLRRLTRGLPAARAAIGRVPMRVTAAASIAAVCAVAAVGIFATMSDAPSQPVETASAEPAPAADPPAAITPSGPRVVAAAPQQGLAAPELAPRPAPPPATSEPETSVAAALAAPDESAASQSIPVQQAPATASTPQVVATPRYTDIEQVTPDTAEALAVVTGPATSAALPAEAGAVETRVGQPHLTDPAPLAGPAPARAVLAPVSNPNPAQTGRPPASAQVPLAAVGAPATVPVQAVSAPAAIPGQAVRGAVSAPAPPPNPFDILAALP